MKTAALALEEEEEDRAAREAAIDEMAIVLPQEAAMLVRLVFRNIESDVSRPLAGILKNLADGPMRVSELAEIEGLAQPTATALIDQAEQRGWVRRDRDPDDRRAVIVSITRRGHGARKRLHNAISKLMHERCEQMTSDEVFAAREATRTLETLITVLRTPR